MRDCLLNLSVVRRMPDMTLKTNQGSGTVIPLCITGRREKIYSKSVVVVKRFRLIRAMYFLTTAGDVKRFHRLRAVIRDPENKNVK